MKVELISVDTTMGQESVRCKAHIENWNNVEYWWSPEYGFTPAQFEGAKLAQVRSNHILGEELLRRTAIIHYLAFADLS